MCIYDIGVYGIFGVEFVPPGVLVNCYYLTHTAEKSLEALALDFC